MNIFLATLTTGNKRLQSDMILGGRLEGTHFSTDI